MEKSPQRPTPLSGYVFYDDGQWEFRLPRSEKEDLEMEECLVESFSDNLRYQLFGVTKDILALEYQHARSWDRKNLNRVGCYEKKTGKLASVFRFANGNKSELEPEPEKIAKHPGIIRLRAMGEKMEQRARKAHPAYFSDVNKIARTAAGTIVHEFRGSGLAMQGPIMVLDTLI